MPLEMKGRRVPYDDQLKELVLTQAGDYVGPVQVEDKMGVFYLLPIARDPDVHPEARSIHYVLVPPHRAIEEPDGSLTLRESIGNPHWHGYLTEGRWELTKSK